MPFDIRPIPEHSNSLRWLELLSGAVVHIAAEYSRQIATGIYSLKTRHQRRHRQRARC